MSKGRDLHQQSLQANESGDYLKSLQISDEAMLAYASDKDWLGFAEIHAMRALTLRALSDKTGEQAFLWSALGSLETIVSMARQGADKTALAIPIFNLAKTYDRLENLEEAIKYFEEAVDLIRKYPPPGHANREAVVNDIDMHLATAVFNLKNTPETLKSAEQAVEKLNSSQDKDKYSLDVWRSGAYMRLAQILWNKGEKAKAKTNLEQAKAIVAANPDLKIRKEQIEKLGERFS